MRRPTDSNLEPIRDSGELVFYQTDDGGTRVECRFANQTLWMSQALVAELFQTSKQNVGKHLKAIFDEGELLPAAVVNQWFTTAADGSRSCTWPTPTCRPRSPVPP